MLSSFGLVETKARAIQTGQRFGRLTVLAVGQKSGTYRYQAICQCDCGSPVRSIRFDALLMGATTGCGCVRVSRTKTHGLSRSGHYSRWRLMMARCYDPKCKAYPDYGGRGIKVHAEWHTIEGFVAGLPAGHFAGSEMDRIDNDGDYEPGNVRWVTRKVNSGNRRSAHIVSFNGRSQSITEWAVEAGISPDLLRTRLVASKWPMERALTEPSMSAAESVAVGRKVRWSGHIKKPQPEPRVLLTYPFNGGQATIAEIAIATGIPEKLLRKRICERGWAVERATA